MQNPILASQMVPEPPTYPIESVDRALRLLVLLGERGTVTVSSAADALGVARSTAHRLLAMLQYHDFVRQDELTRGYSAGRQILRIGLAAVDNLDVRSAARPHLDALREEFDETVHLILLDGSTAMFVDSRESHRPLRTASRRGATMPAYATSGGKALLALLEPDELDAHLPTNLEPLTARTLRQRETLLRELEHIRQQGYATNLAESEDDVAAVAVAVPDSSGYPRAAISISMPTSRMSPERAADIAASIRRHADAIGAGLAQAPS
jgi:DNA-binding IclR family transcriptional regulator